MRRPQISSWASRSIARLILLFALIDGSPAGASKSAAQTIRGVLTAVETYDVITNGSVILLGERGDTLSYSLSDQQGYFSLGAPGAGTYFLVAEALGYRAIRTDAIMIGSEDDRVIEVQLSPDPLPVEGVRVETTRSEPEIVGLAATGFYDRAAAGHGEFLYPGDVLAHPASYTPQLFREMTTMVALVPSLHGGTGPWSDQVLIKSHRQGRSLSDRLCSPRIFVDDRLIELMHGETLEDAAPRDKVQAIEVYRAPFGPPMRYLGNHDEDRACGVILIWTRR